MIGHIGKIQHYSTKDGPGIRTTVFMRGCSLRCKWCSNPEFLTEKPQLMYFKDKCQRCGLCASVYPEGIKVTPDGCIIDREKVDFDVLVDTCPYDSYEVHALELTAEELVKKLLKDKEFYETSNGGVTFSGGECLLQSPFILECIKLLHKEGVHVTIDTCGNVVWEEIEEVAKECDLILYDIKAYDSEIHRKCTGYTNDLILENLRKINEIGTPVIVRMIVVPEYNDLWEDLKKRIDFVGELDCVKQVDFLKYHIYGVGKYEKLGLDYELTGLGEVSDSIISLATQYCESKGLKTTVGG